MPNPPIGEPIQEEFPPQQVIEVPETQSPPDPNAQRALGGHFPPPGPTTGTMQSAVDQLTKLTLGGFFILIGIVSGLMIAAGAWLNVGFSEKTATYQELIDKVDEQNDKIDNLSKQL